MWITNPRQLISMGLTVTFSHFYVKLNNLFTIIYSRIIYFFNKGRSLLSRQLYISMHNYLRRNCITTRIKLAYRFVLSFFSLMNINIMNVQLMKQIFFPSTLNVNLQENSASLLAFFLMIWISHKNNIIFFYLKVHLKISFV